MKAKGRRLQNKVRDRFRELGKKFGLVSGDVNAAVMGESGLDVKFSPAATALFNLAIECKAVENLSYFKVFTDHHAKYEKTGAMPLLIHTKNRALTLVTLTFDDFMGLYEKTLPSPPTESVQQ